MTYPILEILRPLAKRGTFTVRQLVVLLETSSSIGPLEVREIKRIVAIPASAVSRAADKLSDLGETRWSFRQRHESNKRLVSLISTDEGQSLADSLLRLK